MSNYMQRGKKVAIFILVLLLMIGILSYSGFCIKNMGYLSDEEKIRIAVKFILKDNKVYKRTSDIDNVRPYHDVDEFLKDNPDCCQVGFKFMSCSSFFRCFELFTLPAIFGRHSDQVFIKYVSPYAEEIRDTGSYYKSKENIAITNCGGAWDVIEVVTD